MVVLDQLIGVHISNPRNNEPPEPPKPPGFSGVLNDPNVGTELAPQLVLLLKGLKGKRVVLYDVTSSGCGIGWGRKIGGGGFLEDPYIGK